MAKKQKKGKSNRGKQIGNAFELTVVKLIRKAVSKRFADEICYRTPGSGGHYIIGGADIVIEPKLRKYFDFAIECKKRKTIKMQQLYEPKKGIKIFMSQTLENTYEKGDYPLLVIRGMRTPIFCASTLKAFRETGFDEIASSNTPGFVCKYRGATWKFLLLKFLLKELRIKIKPLREDD